MTRNWLIVRRGAWGARLVRLETEVRGRMTGWDVERGERWEGSSRAVLARHAEAAAAQAALSRVRRSASELQAEVERASRAARKVRARAEAVLQKEASHVR